MRTSRTFLFGTLLVGLLLAACDGSSSGEEEGARTLVLRLFGVEPLSNGFHYEAWAVLGTTAGATNVSIGKFNVDANGDLVTLGGTPIPGRAFETTFDLNGAGSFFITIEPNGDTDQQPSTTRYLGGDAADGPVTLTTDHRRGIGQNMASANGTFILSTPTDGPDTNEESGLWFMNLTAGAPGRGLNLPSLSTGWTYEGWAIIDGIAVTTGTFEDLSDADNTAPYSGSMAGFDFPGEDFLASAPSGLTFPTFLNGSSAVVTMEPTPDPDPAPFTLKLLTGPVPTDAVNSTTYNLTNNSAAFPTGTVSIVQ